MTWLGINADLNNKIPDERLDSVVLSLQFIINYLPERTTRMLARLCGFYEICHG